MTNNNIISFSMKKILSGSVKRYLGLEFTVFRNISGPLFDLGLFSLVVDATRS